VAEEHPTCVGRALLNGPPSCRPLQRYRSGWLVAAAAAVTLAAAWLNAPRPFVVVGRSMLPGLAEGEVVTIRGWLASWQRPARHQRWLVRMPNGTRIVKRIAGLPGEQLSFDQGDLLIDGERQLPSPHLLSETATHVRGGEWNTIARGDISWREYHHRVVDLSKPEGHPDRLVPGPIYDRLDADPDERRRLVAVSSVGLTALIDNRNAEAATVFVRIGPQAAALHLRDPRRHAMIAGRIAGQFVVAAWPLPESSPSLHAFHRSPIPKPPYATLPWSLITTAKPSSPAEAPVLALGIQGPEALLTTIAPEDTLHIWRSIHHMPPANGVHAWTIPAGHVFVLGDHPSASRDSRHFGPVPTSNLLGPLLR
jgi:type IV secretory pathway protease TraF